MSLSGEQAERIAAALEALSRWTSAIYELYVRAQAREDQFLTLRWWEWEVRERLVKADYETVKEQLVAEPDRSQVSMTSTSPSDLQRQLRFLERAYPEWCVPAAAPASDDKNPRGGEQ